MTTTTLQHQSTSALSPTGTQFNLSNIENPKSVKADIIRLEIKASQPLSVKNSKDIDDVIAEFEMDLEMAAAMADARKKLSQTLYNENPQTFSAVRLAVGMSQEQLAVKAFTSQPYIAKIEAGRNDPGTDVIAKLAIALNLDEEIVFKAIRSQRKLREEQL